MSGLAFIFIGRRKTGKTTLTKKLLDKRSKNMPCMVYDINKEYGKYYPKPFVDFQVFLEMISDEKIKNTYIVIEEATIFFDTSSRFEEMKNILVRARHTGNIIQMNFHSFLSVPKNIFNLLDYCIIFKTNDTIMTVKAKYDNESVISVFEEARQSKDEFFYKTVNLY